MWLADVGIEITFLGVAAESPETPLMEPPCKLAQKGNNCVLSPAKTYRDWETDRKSVV